MSGHRPRRGIAHKAHPAQLGRARRDLARTYDRPWWKLVRLSNRARTRTRSGIRIGFGVRRHVARRSGELFVWDVPFSDGFTRVKVSVERPEGVDFVRIFDVREFNLYVERALVGRPLGVRLTIFGGLAAETGVFLHDGA